jgi:hypothetical protein
VHLHQLSNVPRHVGSGMSEAARNIVRFVCKQHDVIVICNAPSGVIILASPAGQDAVEEVLPDALQWLDPAADLYFPEGWQQATAITGTPGAEIANEIERQSVSVLVADLSRDGSGDRLNVPLGRA